MITKSSLDLKYYKLDFFTYITSKRYILMKFYKIEINTKVFK